MSFLHSLFGYASGILWVWRLFAGKVWWLLWLKDTWALLVPSYFSPLNFVFPCSWLSLRTHWWHWSIFEKPSKSRDSEQWVERHTIDMVSHRWVMIVLYCACPFCQICPSGLGCLRRLFVASLEFAKAIALLYILFPLLDAKAWTDDSVATLWNMCESKNI